MRILLAACVFLSLFIASTTTAQTRLAATWPTSRPTFAAGEADRLIRLGSRKIQAHDPSTLVQCGQDYWVFVTGRGIRSSHSHDLVTWEPGPPVFDTAPKWNTEIVPGTRNLSYWAPDVIHLGDRYLLYYSVSVFGKNTSAIGLASNPTLDPNDPAFKWNDEGVVVQSVAKDTHNTIDPAIMHDRDGKLWLAFGSYWSGIKLIELDPKTGKRIAPDSQMYSLAYAKQIEASYIYRHGDDYFLFVNWGFCCRGVFSTYNIRVGRASKITGPYLDKDGKDMLDGGGTLFAGSDGAFIGPGHAGIITKDNQDYVSMHFYDGTHSGLGTLAIRPLTWNANGWPQLMK